MGSGNRHFSVSSRRSEESPIFLTFSRHQNGHNAEHADDCPHAEHIRSMQECVDEGSHAGSPYPQMVAIRKIYEIQGETKDPISKRRQTGLAEDPFRYDPVQAHDDPERRGHALSAHGCIGTGYSRLQYLQRIVLNWEIRHLGPTKRTFI